MNRYFSQSFLNAFEKNDVNKIRFLLHNNNENLQNIKGITLLIQAAIAGHIDMVQFLITEKNVDINMILDRGITVFIHLVNIKNIDMVRFLINIGLDINKQDNNGFTALDYAIANKDKEMIKLLLRNNAKTKTELCNI